MGSLPLKSMATAVLAMLQQRPTDMFQVYSDKFMFVDLSLGVTHKDSFQALHLVL